jgi:hypothetical protein
MSSKLPLTGGFPGFRSGTNLFSAWTDAMIAQASAWDELWGKLRDGTFTSKDWTGAIVESVERSAAFMQNAALTLAGPLAPPWASLPPRAPAEITVRHSIDDTKELRVSAFSLLGSEQPKTLPTATASRLAAYRISVALDDHKLTGVLEGEYIALVFSSRYADPIAIVTLSVKQKAPAPVSARTSKK